MLLALLLIAVEFENLRSACGTILAQFTNCRSIGEVAARILTMDGASLVGVIVLLGLVPVMVLRSLGHATAALKVKGTSRLPTPFRNRGISQVVILLPFFLVFLIGCSAGFFLPYLHG